MSDEEEKEDWSYTSHIGKDLRGVNLSGANLKRAVFDGADLEGADLSGADMRRASFKGANLMKAAFDNADMRNAIFIKDKMNIYIDIKNSTLDRLKNYNENNKNKQNCRYFIDNSIKF